MRDYRVHALVIAYIHACVCIYIYILYFSKKRKQITRPNWRHRGQRNLAKLSKKLRPLSLEYCTFPFFVHPPSHFFFPVISPSFLKRTNQHLRTQVHEPLT